MLSFRKTLILLAGIFLLVLLLPATAPALKIVLKPMVNVSGRIDTNFFKTENNEREIYTLLLSPGIQLGLEAPKTKILFNYTLEAYYYDDNSSVPQGQSYAKDNNYYGHLAALNARYSPTRRLTLGLDDSFYHTRYATAYERLSDGAPSRKFNINILTPMIFYDFENKFSTGLRYRKTDIDFMDTKNGDSEEHRIIYNLIYDPTRTITFDLEYQGWKLDYDAGGFDYTSNQIQFIVQKRYKYWAIDAGLGYHRRHFDDSSQKSEDAFPWKISFLWQNPPPPTGRRFLGRIFLRPKSHLFVSIENNFNTYGTNYSNQRFIMDVGHTFLEKIEARIKGYYQQTAYDNSFGETSGGRIKKRSDDKWFIAGSAGYLFTQRLTFSLEGGLEESNSNIIGGGYDNMFLLLRLDFNYDFKSRGGFTDESYYY